MNLGRNPSTAYAGLHPYVREMFDKLNNLSILISDIHATLPEHAGDEKSSLSDKLGDTERYMHILIHSKFGNDSSVENPFFKWRAYPIAGNIFLSLYLRDIPLNSTVLDYLVAILQEALTETDAVRDASMYSPEALFWILVIGGVAALGRAQQQWFQIQAAKIRVSLGLSSWGDARQILKKFAFAGIRCESHCQALWDELS